MKKRYLYALTFAILGFLVGVYSATFSFVFILGFAWLFIFGDSYSPDWLNPFAAGVALIIIFFISITSIIVGYNFGKKAEQQTRKFKLWQAWVMIGLLSLGIWIFTNKPYITDPEMDQCKQLCIEHGFDGNSYGVDLPKNNQKSCSCFDQKTGNYEVVGKVPANNQD